MRYLKVIDELFESVGQSKIFAWVDFNRNKIDAYGGRYIISKKFNESSDFSSEDIMRELTLNLLDAGLQVNIYSGAYKYSNHPKFEGGLNVEITDNDKVFCKKYCGDDMDWLYEKPIIMEFLDDLTEFGLIRDKDYKLFGGGLSVHLVFDEDGIKKIKL